MKGASSWVLVFAVLLATGCGGDRRVAVDAGPRDSGRDARATVDAGPRVDAGPTIDAGRVDGGADAGAPDAGETDAGRPRDGGGLGEGDICIPGGAPCGEGLSCCYPCGVPDCDYRCEPTCSDSMPGCAGGCLLRP